MNTLRMMCWTCLLALGTSACGQPAVSELAQGQAEDGLNRLGTAVNNWYARKRDVPPSLQALVDVKYLKAEQLVDPWGTPYRLDDHGTVCSSGPDKTAGTTDDICKAR